MCTCSMRIACKPGSEVPEHLNLSRTPARFLSARLTQSRVVCVFACLSRPSTGTLTPPPPTNDAGAGRDLMANVTPGVRWLRSLVNLSPGMAVTVEIKTGTRRIISYLLSPLARYTHDSLRER